LKEHNDLIITMRRAASLSTDLGKVEAQSKEVCGSPMKKPIRCQNCGQQLNSLRDRHTYQDCRKRIEYLNSLEEKLQALMEAQGETELAEALQRLLNEASAWRVNHG